MINPMQQVVIAMRRRESEAIITALQDAGVVHIRPLEQDVLKFDSSLEKTDEDTREAERLLARVESTIAELTIKKSDKVVLPDRAEWSKRIEEISLPVTELAKKYVLIQSDLDTADSYFAPVEAVAKMIGSLDTSKRLKVIPFLLHDETDDSQLKNELTAALESRYEIAFASYDNGKVGALAVLASEYDTARSVLSKMQLAEMRLPGRFEGMPFLKAAEELSKINTIGRGALEESAKERKELSTKYAPELFGMRTALKDLVAINDVRSLSARGKYSLVMEGYIPVDRTSKLESALSNFGDGVLYEFSPVDEHHDANIPVELVNSNYVKPFQSILSLASLPKYGTFDPTAVLAYFIPFFFGMIVADVGYGLLYLAFGMWLLGKVKRNESWKIDLMSANIKPPALKDLAHITNWFAIWSIIWGVLTGEFFGTLLEKLGFFYFDADLINALWGWTGIHAHAHEAHHFLLPHVIPIVFPRLEVDLFANVALVIALLFGILQVFWGWGIRMQQGIKHNDKLHTIEGFAMFSGLFALVMMAFASTAGKNLENLTNFSDIRVILMYLGFFGFLAGYVQIITQVPLLIMELFSQGGAIVSYARLFAVGLVSAIFAKLSTEAGMSLYDSMGMLGFIPGILIGALLHVAVLALTLIGHILQPIRLHLLEFLNPTGFHNESSPLYKPFTRLSSED